MRLRSPVTAIMAILAVVLLSVAKDFWEQPFTKWNNKEVVKMFEDSPWSQVQTFTKALGGKGSGMGGEKEVTWKYTIQFFSALPIREAFVRMYQLRNNYDQMSDDKRTEFDSRFKRALNLDVSNQVIVAFRYETNDPDGMREVKRYLEEATVDRLKQGVYLISARLGRIDLKEYFPPAPDGTGAKFIFPRVVNDKPVVLPEDKEVKFDMWAPGAEERIFITFKPARMVYKGQVAY